jgi:Viral BACON domain
MMSILDEGPLDKYRKLVSIKEQEYKDEYIKQALQRLPILERTCLLLQIEGEFAIEDIADVVERSQEEVAAAIHDAREHVCQHYHDFVKQEISENDLSQLHPVGQMIQQEMVEPSPHRQSYKYPPRSLIPQGERVAVTHVSRSLPPLQVLKRATVSRMKQASPKLIFWISTAIFLLISGLFGIISIYAHKQIYTSNTLNIGKVPSLQINPHELSVGTTMTLTGDNFSPHASIGLMLDNAIPLKDTNGVRYTYADTTGHFTDTITVGNNWGIGSRMIRVEDPLTHKVASFPIRIDEQEASLRPPHLHLSANTLDFGSGDPTTNTPKALTLSNSGSGEINWQASTSETWLSVTPTQGNFTHDIPQQVTVAVNRSKLGTGSYNAQLHFTSNGGDPSLDISMQVTPLTAEHTALMQISPAVLSFTATDGSSPTTSQQITISNLGGQSMNWSASSEVRWLTVSPASMTIAPNNFAIVQVSVASGNLLPDTYTGTLTFTAQNSLGDRIVFSSRQQVVISVTVMPPCTLQVESALIDFSSAYDQPAPSAKQVNVTATGCSTATLDWTASSNQTWLTLNNTSGTTPGTLSFGVDVTGLAPDTYTGAIMVSSDAGTQTIIVRFILGPPSTAVISVNTPALYFNSILAPASPAAKTVLLTNTGEGVLHWQADTIANLDISWFDVTPTDGILPAHQTTALTVTIRSSTVLASGNYNGAISLSGTNDAGQSATGSPQNVLISYVVPAPPLLVTTPSSINISVSGTTLSSINLMNAGGSALNWSATLQSDAPSFISLSETSGLNLAAGAMVSFNVVVNTEGIASGQYQTSVTINATDPANDQPVNGSPATILITMIVT